MIAVIFEVWPAEGCKDDYLGITASLRADLNRMDGLISVERFQSLTDQKKLLSLSFWRDDEAVRKWRNHSSHRESQIQGRAGIFADSRHDPLRGSGPMRSNSLTQNMNYFSKHLDGDADGVLTLKPGARTPGFNDTKLRTTQLRQRD